MFINEWEVIANNKIEMEALALKEKSIIEDPTDYLYGINVLDNEFMRIAVALRAKNECSFGDYKDFTILILKGCIKVSFKRDIKWEPPITMIPQKPELFYAAYILEKNEPLKRAFFKKLRRSDKYKNNNMYRCFRNFKSYKLEKIEEGRCDEEIIHI